MEPPFACPIQDPSHHRSESIRFCESRIGVIPVCRSLRFYGPSVVPVIRLWASLPILRATVSIDLTDEHLWFSSCDFTIHDMTALAFPSALTSSTPQLGTSFFPSTIQSRIISVSDKGRWERVVEPQPQYQILASSLSIPITRERHGIIQPRNTKVSHAGAQWALLGVRRRERKRGTDVIGTHL